MSEKELGCNISPIFAEKWSNGTILIPELTIELDPLHAFDQRRQKVWIQNEIVNVLENETTPFLQYLETTVPNQTNTQREKKLKEFKHIINMMNQVLPNWTDITHDPSQVRIVSSQQETLIKNLITQIPENGEPIFVEPSYLFAEFPQPYYVNGALFYKASDIKKHLTYISFDPIQRSVVSLYQKAVERGVEPSTDRQFQNIYINCLLGYMNGVKMLYKTLIIGELIKQIHTNSENTHLLLEELADQITHHSLITYIQKSGIVFPLQTVIIFKKNNRISLPNTEEIKDVMTFMCIGTDRKKKYDGIAQHLADQELGSDSNPQSKKYQQTNDLLQRLSINGYDFSSSAKRGYARITDEQTKSDIDCELDSIVYEGNQSAWQKVWHDMQNGVLV